MTEIKPLLDSELSEELASVLRSAEADGPQEHAMMQSQTLAAVAAHRGVGSHAREHGASTGIPFAKTMLALVIACAGSAAVLSTFESSAPQDAHPATPSAPAIPSAPATPTSSPEGMHVDDLPTARVEEPKANASAPPAVRRGGSGLELDDEVAIIDSARAALAAKRPETALARVETYHRRFRSGHLTEEANALEIQALAAMGRRDEANAKGQRFLASYPRSAYEQRVRSVLASEVTP